MTELNYGPADLARDLALSSDAIHRLEAYRAILAETNAHTNLIGPNELDHFWRRHALDCAQLAPLAPDARRWLDLGSGAGLPGLIVACVLKGTPGAEIHLVEATAKKAAFLARAVEALNLPAQIFIQRIEDFMVELEARPPGAGDKRYDVVTARALAPLPRLIAYAKPVLDRGAQGLFHKGAQADAELAAARQALDGGASEVSLRADVLESLSDPRGRIIRITKAAR